MSKLEIKGDVVYAPGPWGPALGVQDATLELFDQDGTVRQRIWRGTTGTGGGFAGTTDEWQATIPGPPMYVVDFPGSLVPPRPPRGHWEPTTLPDPTDILLLSMRIAHPAHGEITLPFVSGGNGTTSPPLVVPPTWIPAGHSAPVYARVDGRSYAQPEDAARAISKAVDAKRPAIVLEIHEAATRDALHRLLTGSRDALLAELSVLLPGVPPQTLTRVWGGDDVALVILALAGLVLAVGAATFTVVISFAVIYAMSQGYTPIEVELRTDPSGEQYLHVKFGT